LGVKHLFFWEEKGLSQSWKDKAKLPHGPFVERVYLGILWLKTYFMLSIMTLYFKKNARWKDKAKL